MKVTMVDYGMGNLRSVQKALEKVGCTVLITQNKSDVARAEKLVIPGVGAFGDAMQNLIKFDLLDPIKAVVAADVPVLGICLGLQVLFTRSYEDGVHDGLGLLAGEVKRFPDTVKVPHMGWNQIKVKKPNPLLVGIADDSFFYFVHSYYVKPDDQMVISAETEYGINFTAMAAKNNLFGIQFHPEKSQELGLRILDNFRKV
jgi:imidazole glycerol-phosphate synthase subunit HisH